MNKIKPPRWPADRVERRPIDALIPYARNARTHSDAQIAQLAASITEWGWTSPVLVDEAGSIIAGHGRVLAARKLGLSDLPVMVARGWSDAKKRAYVLADNRLALNADWDVDLLTAEIGELQDVGFDVALLGFSDVELGDLFKAEALPIDETGEQSGFQQQYLKFGDKKIPLTDDEVAVLDRLYEQHMEETGVAFGFARKLIGENV